MTKSILKLSLVASLAISGLNAGESKSVVPGLSTSADVTFSSNTIWRGAGTQGGVEGTLNLEHDSGVYAGLWGAGAFNELDLIIGYGTEVAGLNLDLGYCNMAITGTTGKKSTLNTDVSGEVYLGLSADVGVELGAKVYKEVVATDSKSLIAEFSASKELGKISLNATYGKQLDSDIGGGYYSVGFQKPCKITGGSLSLTYARALAKEGTNPDAVYGVAHTMSF